MPRDVACGDAAVLSGNRRRTHQAIRANAARAASGLRAAGIGRDDAIALLLRNDFAFFEAALAARQLGAFTVPLNWHADADDIAYILRDCRAKALVVHADLIDRIDPELRGERPLLIVATPPEIAAAFGRDERAGPLPAGAEEWEPWLRGYPPIAEPAEGPGAPIIYTSGTTGRPKGVRRTGGKTSKGSAKARKVYGFDHPERITALITGPMYHSVPNAYARLALEAGAEIVLEPRFDPEDMLATVERHAISHMHIVPAMFVRLLRLPDPVKRRYDLASLRHVVHGAAACPREVKTAMLEWWGPVVHEYYGSTETGLLTLLDPREAAARPGSVGRPLPGISLHVLDGGGDAVAAGTTGDIYAGSATLHDFTYLGLEAKRAEVGRGDLVTAGDIGWLDADGYLYLCDRKRDVIHTDVGEIYPATVEAAILRFEGVRDCAVFGLSADEDEARRSTVCACIAAVDGAPLDLDGLKRAILEAAGAPRIDLRLEIVDELPREESGKIFKQALRARYAARGN